MSFASVLFLAVNIKPHFTRFVKAQLAPNRSNKEQLGTFYRRTSHPDCAFMSRPPICVQAGRKVLIEAAWWARLDAISCEYASDPPRALLIGEESEPIESPATIRCHHSVEGRLRIRAWAWACARVYRLPFYVSCLRVSCCRS
jgi:hypothetical protein